MGHSLLKTFKGEESCKISVQRVALCFDRAVRYGMACFPLGGR